MITFYEGQAADIQLWLAASEDQLLVASLVDTCQAMTLYLLITA